MNEQKNLKGKKDMNKRISKKKMDFKIYGKNKKLNKRRRRVKVYVDLDKMTPQRLWVFWCDGSLGHWGIFFEEALSYIEDGYFYTGRYKIENFIITDHNLRLIASVGSPCIDIEIDKLSEYGYVVSYYVRTISLKTKRACDWYNDPDEPDEYEHTLTHIRYICEYIALNGEVYKVAITSKDDIPLTKEQIVGQFIEALGFEMQYESPERIESQCKIEMITPKWDSPLYGVIFSEYNHTICALCHADSRKEAMEIFDSTYFDSTSDTFGVSKAMKSYKITREMLAYIESKMEDEI